MAVPRGERSELYVGMTGFDSVILDAAFSVWDGNGSHYPLLQTIAANTSIFAKLDTTVRNAFARAERELAPAALAFA